MVVVILVALILLFAVVVLAKTVRIVPQARAGVVERLGRFQRICGAGLNLLVPVVGTAAMVHVLNRAGSRALALRQ